ncbi:DSS1/SEM1 domain-containing protein [Neofusicoccum parvum]|uniref:26S proteasome complex subunit SEM1 n=3 Tax=Neofusicoccum TaxID=407951 RepID=R1EGS1_BOTPV|nr:putative dss1 sem1 domain-containing protein [Neofusicoccum parvum UCRNP2]GME31251.1 DSS1/SEM1 domain-containing protein [Neofusicoccum parvum]GME52921.1 DSS1/SEM1 domain-containing protein [Neofusicoccum parvum]
MSAPAPGDVNTKKAVDDASNEPKDQQKPAAALEEDDEFEDFPVEDWEQEDTELPASNTHLWEESWDDDDTSEDFSAQLKEELKKVESKRG